ncbi:extracellular serine-rich [Pyrenophora seminiperda CCB06]|uniref:Extracellular serine-rich n=1 Tax=Pyrenophora seminiperda CCB06 TaxID=1302712 RepID=A0A3M7M7T0_9PLEO|nr:extracellular serine-rich [Pyrenophora seminiperda CCB06]
MVSFSPLSLAAITAILSLTTTALPAVPVPPTGVIHRITAGSTTANAGLHFEPENVVAQPGDVIEFHFLPKAHTVTQSSFSKPCEPLGGPTAIFSGFNFNTTAGEAPNVFSFTVNDTKPIWYYCSQTANNHCQKGMSGVINQDFSSENTLARYKEMAVGTVTGQPSADPLASNGGLILPNLPL